MSKYIVGIAQRAEEWLKTAALPLWSSRGFDAKTKLFEEQLTLSGDPITTVPRRLMVQARQIAVFSAASISGRYPSGRQLALTSMHRTIEQFYEADGHPGWVFSIDRQGRPVDRRRDLYAHAFVLFALAWALRLDRSAELMEIVDLTLNVLDDVFADPLHGGFWDCLPRPDALRRQNPHMHLFEAFIELFESTGQANLLDRCRGLRELAVRHFIEPETGALREYFYDDWEVYPAPGRGSVEPGHLFEWAWLFHRWQLISGDDQNELIERLMAFAYSSGLDPVRGRVVDEVGEDGLVRRSTSRSWPHAEALKAIANEVNLNCWVSENVSGAILLRLLEVYCPKELGGGWYDHVDEDDRPISGFMPASTFYHVYFGIDAACRIL